MKTIERRNGAKREVQRQADFLGLPINIEIEAGDTKSGIGDEGEAWEKTYDVPYGEIDGTLALSDGDPVDVYLGSFATPEARVYVVHQQRKSGEFDEDKVMLGFRDAMEAMHAYQRHGPPWGFGSMDDMTLDEFVNGYLASNRPLPAAVHPNTAGDREALGSARYGS